MKHSHHTSNYGWAICFACALLLFCTGGLGLTGFAVYQPYLISLSGLTNTQTSTLVTIRSLSNFLSLLLVSKLISRYEVRRVVSVSTLICAVSFFAYGFFSHFPGYCLAAALAGIAAGLGGSASAAILISRWFNEHRGLALGICMGATGFSSLFASPVITFLVENLSLRTAFTAEAAFVLLSAFIIYIVLRSKPECLHTEPVGASHLSADQVYASHTAPKKQYMIMMIGIFLFGIPGNLLSSHVSVLYQSAGFDYARISVILSIYGLALGTGKCTYGLIADKIGTFRASRILYVLVLLGSGLCCLAGRSSYSIAYLAVCILGFGLAVTSVSMPMYASGIAAEKDYARTVSRFQTLSTLGSLLLGPVPGMIADHTGSYVPAFIILSILTFVSSLILLITYRQILREETSSQKRSTSSIIRSIRPDRYCLHSRGKIS